MIDNQQEVQELIALLEQHLPLRVFPTEPLVESIRHRGGDLTIHDPVEVESVLYLGDEGGIACAIEIDDGKSVVMASITHLRIDRNHLLAGRIQAYQARRVERIEATERRGSSAPRSRRPTQRKRKKTGASRRQRTTRDESSYSFFLACEQWRAGDYLSAAAAFAELLERDPKDGQYTRYWLASCLFLLDAGEPLDEALDELDDHSGVWRYAQALRLFRLHGDREEARQLLSEAHHLEPGFADYLLRDKGVDASLAVQFDTDLAARAFGCARLFLPVWRGVPGAVTWARRALNLVRSDTVQASRRFPEAELRDLPPARGTWQVGLRESRGDSESGESPLWLLGVANVDHREMRTLTVIEESPTEAHVWEQLIEALVSPLEGAPARPRKLIVCRRDFCDAWRPLLKKIGVRCEFVADPQPVGQLLEAMGEAVLRQQAPPAEGLDIREFPQSDAVWQADFFSSPAWVLNERQQPHRPWSVHVLDKEGPRSLLIAHAPDVPTPEMLLEFLVRVMARPGGGPAERPRLIEVADSDCYDYLRPRLAAAEVECRLHDELPEFNDFCLSLARSMDSSQKCALADGQGVTREDMESFYEAAANYFRAAPWRRVPGEVPIEIHCDDPALGTRYAIVLGRTGVQLGLCVYDDWKTTIAMLNGIAGPEESRALAICYDEADVMAAVDLQWIERLGWPIATPEAWPAVMRLSPGRTPRSANRDELVFLDACLRAIPEFLTEKKDALTYRATIGTRPVELRLAWRTS